MSRVRTWVPQSHLRLSAPHSSRTCCRGAYRDFFPVFITGEGEDLLAEYLGAETHLVCKKRQFLFIFFTSQPCPCAVSHPGQLLKPSIRVGGVS